MHIQLLNCMEALLKVLGSEVKVISQSMFNLILTVVALSTEQQVSDKVAFVCKKKIVCVLFVSGLGFFRFFVVAF